MLETAQQEYVVLLKNKMMQTSSRLDKVQGSLTLEIDARAKDYRAAGKDVISLAAGEPDFDPPAFVIEAAQEAMARGQGRYTAVAGHPDLRRSAALAISNLTGLSYESGHVVVSSGAKQSLFNALYVVADPGSEVLIPAPYWTSYPEMVRALDLVPVFVPTNDSFAIEADELAKRITKKTRAIILNSPSNHHWSRDDARRTPGYCRRITTSEYLGPLG